MSLPVKYEQNAGENANQYLAQGNQHIYTINASEPNKAQISALKKIIVAYKKEVLNPDRNHLGNFIDKLNFFITKVDGDFLDIKSKLEAGGFHADVELGTRLKHEYFKELQKIKHINSAQKIHAYLLGLVLMSFQEGVYLHLHKNENKPSIEFVKELVRLKVIEPVEKLLSIEENVLEVYYQDIYSMIYFLTGNCHIKWN
jgi:hypothetical protein